MIKCYSEMLEYDSYAERLKYLQFSKPGMVGSATFGPDRGLNQLLYKSPEWARLRHRIIVRDLGCDLAIPGLEIAHSPIIHHINPITKEDILERSKYVFDPEYLVCVSRRTHDMIHYNYQEEEWHERTPNDTIPWR